MPDASSGPPTGAGSPEARPLPEELAVDWLAPWAVALRYDEPAASLDRAAALTASNSACGWANALLDVAAPGGS